MGGGGDVLLHLSLFVVTPLCGGEGNILLPAPLTENSPYNGRSQKRQKMVFIKAELRHIKQKIVVMKVV